MEKIDLVNFVLKQVASWLPWGPSEIQGLSHVLARHSLRFGLVQPQGDFFDLLLQSWDLSLQFHAPVFAFSFQQGTVLSPGISQSERQ